MKILLPWKNLGCLALRGENFYFDIYKPGDGKWYTFVLYIGWMKKWGKFKPPFFCKYCKPRCRMICLELGGCVQPRTRIYFPSFKITCREM